MKSIQAYDCRRRSDGSRKATRTAVCFVLDAAHASHTMRVFARDQAPGAVVRALPRSQAVQLLSGERAEEAATSVNVGRAGRGGEK